MKSFLLVFIFFTCQVVCATHLRGGYIHITKNAGLSYHIRVTVFTNTTNTNVLFGGEDDILDFGDGASMLIPEIQNVEVRPGFFKASFEVVHVYKSSGRYVVSYSEPNRNEGIVNIDQSVNTRLYLESSFLADASIPYESPEFLTDPFYIAALGSPYSFGVNAVDPNEYLLTYEVVTPKSTLNYQLPENFKVDLYSGLCTWDTKFQSAYVEGEYLLNIRVNQYDNNIYVGYKILDFQVIAHEGPTSLAISQFETGGGHNDFFVPPGSDQSWRISFYDVDNISDSLNLEVYSEADISFTTKDSLINDKPAKVGYVTFRSPVGSGRKTPYLITVRGNSFSSTAHTLSSDLTIVVKTTDEPIGGTVTAISDHSVFHYSLYPNPFEGEVRVSLGSENDGQLHIYSPDGRLWFGGKVKAGETLDLANAPHFLIYKILTPKSVQVGKIVRK